MTRLPVPSFVETRRCKLESLFDKSALSTSSGRDACIYRCISICGPGAYNSEDMGYLNSCELGLGIVIITCTYI